MESSHFRSVDFFFVHHRSVPLHLQSEAFKKSGLLDNSVTSCFVTVIARDGIKSTFYFIFIGNTFVV